MRSAEISNMDSDEALKLLKRGTEGIAVWNWRRKEGAGIPDLRDASLRDANLSGANLSRADLSGAKLSGANLSDANLSVANISDAELSDANLSGANLSAANISGAKLSGAKLSGAKLSGAKLSGANLNGANLSGANLSGANLTGATLSGAKLISTRLVGAMLADAVCGSTVFTDVDLSETDGLGSVTHWGPSSVGIDPIFRSKGKIPEAFLRGCGVPDSVIVNRFDLVGASEPIKFYSCFISHSTKDKAFATRLHSRMVQEQLRVWYAPEDMRGGRKNVDQIDQAIHVHDKLLLALSKASMESDWVRYEITRAVEQEKHENRQVLFPIGLVSRKAILSWSAFDSDSGKDIGKVVREYHIPDFSKWKDHDAFESAFAGLLDDLKAENPAGTFAVAPNAIRRRKMLH
jgi:TIR domain/Pentapeptide repeats (8 copies)